MTDIIKPTAKVVVNVDGIEAEDNIKLTEEAEEILRFKFDQCDYESISEKRLRQHMGMKHRISQVDWADDTEDESREENIPLTTSEVIENSSKLEECKSLPVGNESETFDLHCFNMLGITEKCAIVCNKKVLKQRRVLQTYILEPQPLLYQESNVTTYYIPNNVAFYPIMGVFAAPCGLCPSSGPTDQPPPTPPLRKCTKVQYLF